MYSNYSELLKQIAIRAFEKSFFQRERREFLEHMVCTYSKTTPKQFRALDLQKQADLMKFALGVMKMKIANQEQGN